MSLSDIGDAFSATVLSGSLGLAILVAMIAGVVAFVSPCVLPVVPGYLSYVSGMAGQNLGPGAGKRAEPRTGRMLAGSLLFIAGFTAVFMVIGGFVGALSYALQAYSVWINRVAGVVVIIMGLLFMGAFPALSREKRIASRPDGGLLGAPLLGATFGLAWTPCMGPTFAAVVALSLEGASPQRGAVLALAYSLGLGIPFVLFALLFQRALGASRAIAKHRRLISILSGLVLIAIGVALLTGQWSAWMDALSQIIGTYETVV